MVSHTAEVLLQNAPQIQFVICIAPKQTTACEQCNVKQHAFNLHPASVGQSTMKMPCLYSTMSGV
jgi:hypothetical protein